MNFIFNQSSIGYSHVEENKVCQDFSSSYKDNNRIIISCADGHGGSLYIRSHIGSKIANYAALEVFKSINKKYLTKTAEEDFVKKIKIGLLCEWNKLIEREQTNSPLKRSEFVNLSKEQIEDITFNPSTAYGTTLCSCLVLDKKVVVLSIGDSEAIGFKKGNVFRIFDTSDDPAGNITYSLCQEDAYKYLRVRVLNINDIDGVILCTDGLSSPYQTYSNLTEYLVKPLVYKTLSSGTTNYAEEIVEGIANTLGIGDDVSLAFFLKGKTKKNYYK